LEKKFVRYRGGSAIAFTLIIIDEIKQIDSHGRIRKYLNCQCHVCKKQLLVRADTSSLPKCQCQLINFKKCSQDGCLNNARNKGLCAKHYNRLKRNGFVTLRSRCDPNEIITDADCAYIVLYDKYNQENERAIIDLDDIEKVQNYKWYKSHGAVRGSLQSQEIFLHRLVTDCPDSLVVDHKNHNELDNRKCNLRICTQSQNIQNKSISKNNKSGVTGVCWNQSIKKWVAQIKFMRHNIFLGNFEDIQDAIAVRREAEKKYFGEFSYYESIQEGQNGQ